MDFCCSCEDITYKHVNLIMIALLLELSLLKLFLLHFITVACSYALQGSSIMSLLKLRHNARS